MVTSHLWDFVWLDQYVQIMSQAFFCQIVRENQCFAVPQVSEMTTCAQKWCEIDSSSYGNQCFPDCKILQVNSYIIQIPKKMTVESNRNMFKISHVPRKFTSVWRLSSILLHQHGSDAFLVFSTHNSGAKSVGLPLDVPLA